MFKITQSEEPKVNEVKITILQIVEALVTEMPNVIKARTINHTSDARFWPFGSMQ